MVGITGDLYLTFSSLMAPIPALYKKGKPDRISWTEQHFKNALCALKEALNWYPVLVSPILTNPSQIPQTQDRACVGSDQC